MSYAGDVTPEQAWTVLRDEPGAVLVDVRTRAEWSYVGLPDLSAVGKEVVLIEWQTYPHGVVNERFTADLEAAGVAKDAPSTSCAAPACARWPRPRRRPATGGRSRTTSSMGSRGPTTTSVTGRCAGWKVAGLPWVQG